VRSYRINKSAICLPAVEALRRLPDTASVYHRERERRHPAAIYNVCLKQAEDRMDRLLTHLERATIRCPQFDDKTWTEELLERTVAFLHACMEYADGAQEVVECFIRPGAKSPPLQLYKKTVREYRDHIGLVVNFIKHEQGRLRLILMNDASDYALGYFVEGVDESGTIGPSRKIHERGRTAFSYNRNLRFHYSWWLLISSAVATAIRAIAECPRETGDLPQGNKLFDLGKRVCFLPPVVFIDELRKPWPGIVTRVENAGEVKLLLDCSAEHPRSFRGSVSIRSGLGPDGVNKKFQLPYVGRD